MKTENIAGLECITLRKPTATKAVILFHGYGANMHDLYSLHEYLDPAGEWDWFFPNGPKRIPMGPMYEGRAWFDINVAALETAMRTGTHRDLSKEVPLHFDEMIEQQIEFVKEIKLHYPKLVIGGFSQGAMCSAHIALRIPDMVNGVIMMSSSLIAIEKMPHLTMPPNWTYFQSHGTADPLLSFSGAQALSTKFMESGIHGEFHSFNGAHEIPVSTVEKAAIYLKKLT